MCPELLLLRSSGAAGLVVVMTGCTARSRIRPDAVPRSGPPRRQRCGRNARANRSSDGWFFRRRCCRTPRLRRRSACRSWWWSSDIPLYWWWSWLPRGSQQAALGEGERLTASDDEMIEHFDLDQRERLLQVARQQLVGLAGLRHARRVVVREDHGRSVRGKRSLDYFARIHACLGQRAAKQFFSLDDAMLRVEPEADENFMLTLQG